MSALAWLVLCAHHRMPGLLPSAPSWDVGFWVLLCSSGAAVAETLESKTLGGLSWQGCGHPRRALGCPARARVLLWPCLLRVRAV